MITNQATLFLIFILNGILIGLLFDFFRILRKTIKTHDIITYIQDFIFWIITGFIILYSTFTFNNGEIRSYMFIGIFIGVLTYMIFLSKHIININVAIINKIKDIFIQIIRIITYPFKKLIEVIKKILIKPFTFMIINIRKQISNNINKIQKLTKSLKNVKN